MNLIVLQVRDARPGRRRTSVTHQLVDLGEGRVLDVQPVCGDAV